ncbi:MAG: hypothetical protein QXQ14_00435 [Candidatus Aenigmatarchaeota archaeon]
MKTLAINFVFLMVIGLITAIVVITIFLAIRSFVFNYFSESKEKVYREVRAYFISDAISQDFLYELIYSCISESQEKNCSEYMVCYYLFSHLGFSITALPGNEVYKNYKIDFSEVDLTKRNLLIVNFCREKIVKVLN